MTRKTRDAWLKNLNHEARMNYYLLEEYLAADPATEG